ncbi:MULTISPECIES: acyltransferase [Sulfurimonas]|uniref:Acyltransferase n=1 Tax=Sulfurimonas diazotrophicus TaxID=3131939 RepID=A0ABZ3H8X0_9BACT
MKAVRMLYGLAAELRESLFLFFANHLPRLNVCNRWRALCLKLAGMRIERKCTIWPGVDIRPIGAASHITIGKGSFVNVNSRFAAPNTYIAIGEDVAIGPNVSFETAQHDLHSAKGKPRTSTSSRPIVVKDRVWIGAGAIILGGVTIYEDAVVAAGAVVDRDVSAGTLVGGIPAKFIKTIEQG